MRFKSAFCATFIFLFAGGCSVPQKPIKAGDILKITETNIYRPFLKMSGDVRVKTAEGWIRSRAALLLKRPGAFRLTINGPAGGTIFFAVANEKTFYYALPAENISKTMARADGRLLRIGSFRISPGDFIENIHPGIESARFKRGKAAYAAGGIRIKDGGVTKEFVFDSKNRLTKALIENKKGSRLSFTYNYETGPGYEVMINDIIRFKFSRVVPVEFLPDRLFEPPDIPNRDLQ